MTHLKNKCAIVGIGETAVGKLAAMTSMGIQLEAIRLALKDAELRPADVDGLLAIQPAEEGIRMWSNVIGCPAEDVRIGDPVVISYVDVTESITLPKFRKSGSDPINKGE